MKYLEKSRFGFPISQKSQLFAETVLADSLWTTKFWGAPKDKAEEIAKEKLAIVGLEESIYDKVHLNYLVDK